ncbi:hypothetical protein [Kushneria indalinina]|uniref:hypothetical protein n=1 Tax=Kushneria indalinina TaxID=184067 RepID=UPI0011C057B6|nr:hypothetical protein [Kushneria indalinina]
MQSVDENYLRDLKRIRHRAQKTLNYARPFGSQLLDSYGPMEAKGKAALMAGGLCSIIVFFVVLYSGFATKEIVTWCLVAAFTGGLLSLFIFPWKTYQQYLSGVLAKCSDDSRLASLRETINRTDMAIDEQCHTILDKTATEINNYRLDHKVS